jgi:hypothetical protein
MTVITRYYRAGEGQAMHEAFADLTTWVKENVGEQVDENNAIYRRNDKGNGPCDEWVGIKREYYRVRGVPEFNQHLQNIILEWGDDWWVGYVTLWMPNNELNYEITVQVPDDLTATQIKLAFLC